MTLGTVNRWITLAANIGVLAGIVVLVIEINQNTQAMNTASRDASVAHILNFFEQSRKFSLLTTRSSGNLFTAYPGS